MPDYHVYILTNVNRNVMYIGVTNDLEQRIADHREGVGGGFTRKYRVNTLVYSETYEWIEQAIEREAD